MVTITSLYICIFYICTYSYNFYYLSSLHSYGMSIFSVTCSMSLAYLLSILLLYSCFYTLHIPYSFYNLLLYFHVLLSCTVHVLCSYTVFPVYFSYYFLLYLLYLFIYFSCTVHLSCYRLLLFLFYYIYHFLCCVYIMSYFM